MKYLLTVLSLGLSLTVFICATAHAQVVAPTGKTLVAPVAKPAAKAVKNTLVAVPASATKKSSAPRVRFETSMGAFTLELNPTKAPITVKNFLSYVDEGYYAGTVFHRVISNFMIQGGGFTEDMNKKKTKAPIKLETGRGLSNMRGTIAMARTNNPNSATSQFFVNVKNNRNLDAMGGGYAVFGKVIEGMDIIDNIRKVKTGRKGPHGNVPLKTVVIKSATRL
jgi:peptidyl-prolyl cis-trans isomerase A (cyclophilin A)